MVNIALALEIYWFVPVLVFGTGILYLLASSKMLFRSSSDTLAGDLIANGGGRVISLEVKRRVKLSGAELEEFRLKVSSGTGKRRLKLTGTALLEFSL